MICCTVRIGFDECLNNGRNRYHLPFKRPISRSRSATLLFEAMDRDVMREGDEVMWESSKSKMHNNNATDWDKYC